MRLTRFGFSGVVFYIAMTGAFYASPYSNLFFLLVAFLTLQWIQCGFATLRNLRAVSAELGDIAPAPAGIVSTVRARVAAPGRARFKVVLAAEFSGSETVQASAQLDVLRGESELALEIPALERGVYSLESARIETTYPLGLFRRWRPLCESRELIVYPMPSEMGDARTGGAALDAAMGANSAGAGDLQPSGVREYRDGDELRSVHWRASARTGTLVVKEWEGASGEGLEVSLDRRCDPEALEGALSLISALVSLARTNKEILALSSQGLHANFGDGHRPWIEALRFLAETQPLAADSPPPPPVARSVARLPLEPVHAG